MHCATVSLNHWVSDLIYAALWNLYSVIHPLGSMSYDRSRGPFRASSSESAIRCAGRARMMLVQRTVVYESARKGEYIIVATKESQHFPFQGRRYCCLTTICTNERKRKKKKTASNVPIVAPNVITSLSLTGNRDWVLCIEYEVFI